MDRTHVQQFAKMHLLFTTFHFIKPYFIAIKAVQFLRARRDFTHRGPLCACALRSRRVNRIWLHAACTQRAKGVARSVHVAFGMQISIKRQFRRTC